MRNFYIFIVLVAKLACTSTCIANDLKKKQSERLNNYEVCCPITMLPNSEYSLIRNKLLGNTDFELAIFSSDNNEFSLIIIWKNENIYHCDVRNILFSEITSDSRLDANLIIKSKVNTKRRIIDEKFVSIIQETLKSQIMHASYKTAPNFRWSNYLDGTTYDIYTKGKENDIFPIYSAKFFNPKSQGSYSCETISLALFIFVTHADEKFRSIPITKLTTYLTNQKEGKDAGPDPMINKPLPEPDMTPPPR